MKYILTSTLLFLCVLTYGQNGNPCDGERYAQKIFDEIKVTPDIKYGEGPVYPSEDNQELFLDVYEPQGDLLDKRPVVVLAFGGSFIEGSRKDIDWLCEEYAKSGYVAVSVDYRLYDGPFFPIPDAEVMKNVVLRAVSDIKGAIRYMRQDAATENIYKIDPEFVFAGGISAGSIAACHTAMLDSTDNIPADLQQIIASIGGLRGNTNDLYQYSSEVQGLVNYSGGLNDASWIDGDDPQFFSVHDDMDPVVPYGEGFARIFGIPIVEMEGSQIMKEVADAVEVHNELITYENSPLHVGYFFVDNQTQEVLERSMSFLHEIICPSVINSTTLSTNTELNIYPNPTSNLIHLTEYSEVTAILSNQMGQILESWRNSEILNISQYSNGMYYLQLSDTEGNSVTHKLIIN